MKTDPSAFYMGHAVHAVHEPPYHVLYDLPILFIFFMVTLQGFGSSEGFRKNLPGSIHLIAVGSERDAGESGLSNQTVSSLIGYV